MTVDPKSRMKTKILRIFRHTWCETKWSTNRNVLFLQMEFGRGGPLMGGLSYRKKWDYGRKKRSYACVCVCVFVHKWSGWFIYGGAVSVLIYRNVPSRRVKRKSLLTGLTSANGITRFRLEKMRESKMFGVMTILKHLITFLLLIVFPEMWKFKKWL